MARRLIFELRNAMYMLRRSWCYKRIVLTIVCLFCMLTLLKLSEPLEFEDDEEESEPEKSVSVNDEFRRNSSLNFSRHYCYRDDDEFGETIVFINLHTPWTGLDRCAVITAALLNPHTPICLLYSGPGSSRSELAKSFSALDNVEVAKLDVVKVLTNTSLLHWYVEVSPGSKKRKYFHTELLDALRNGYLYKYGGTYMDLDVWSLTSFDTLKWNTIGREADHLPYLANFVMSFQKGHSFMADVVRQFPRAVNATKWGSGGILLITRLYHQKWKYVEGKEKINVVDAQSFYPVHYELGPILFRTRAKKRIMAMTKHSYTVHLWREVYKSYWSSKRKKAQGLSFVWTIYEKVCKTVK